MEALAKELMAVVGGNVFVKLLDMLELCGNEADHYDDVSTELWMALPPPQQMVGIPEEVYTAHVRELLLRAMTSEPFNLLTDAELLLAMSEASKVAPLNQEGVIVTRYLFQKVMGEQAYAKVYSDVPAITERWPGQLEDALEPGRNYKVPGRPAKVGSPRLKVTA